MIVVKFELTGLNHIVGSLFQEFTDFKWYAKCGTETYPMLGEEYNNAYPPPLPIGRSPGFAGGVEGLGPGRIDCNVGFLDVTPALYDGMRNGLKNFFISNTYCATDDRILEKVISKLSLILK